MPDLTLADARTILDAALAAARASSFKPLAVVVYDARGALKAAAVEDGSSLKRAEIAMAKAVGSLAMGVPSRKLAAMAAERPQFIAAATHAVGGQLIPVAGGVLVRADDGALLGAVGVSGDTSDNDEVAAVAGIEAAGLTPETGA